MPVSEQAWRPIWHMSPSQTQARCISAKSPESHPEVPAPHAVCRSTSTGSLSLPVHLTRQHTCQCRMLDKAQTWTQSQLPWGRCEQQQHFQPAVWINSLRQDRGFLILCQWQGADLAKEGLKLKHSQSKASSLQQHPNHYSCADQCITATSGTAQPWTPTCRSVKNKCPHNPVGLENACVGISFCSAWLQLMGQKHEI